MKVFSKELTCKKCQKSFIVVGSKDDMYLTTSNENALAYDYQTTKDIIIFSADCIHCNTTNQGSYPR